MFNASIATNSSAGDRPPDLSERQYLRFALADGAYAVPIDAVREILELAPITPLPQMPPFVRGVMNLRGAVVPVIDLAARYGLPVASVGRRSCIVVVDVPSPEPSRPGSQVLGCWSTRCTRYWISIPSIWTPPRHWARASRQSSLRASPACVVRCW
jgi:hypothetical protein